MFIATIFLAVFTAILFTRLRTPLEVPPVSNKITLTYWGITYPTEVMQPLINKYEAQHKNINIEYTERKFENLSNYKSLLRTRLNEGNGPDVFRLHSTWIPEYMPELSFTNTAITIKEFDENFYPVARTQCVTKTGTILCIPLMYDGLVLLYNKPMFQASVLSKPKTWEDLSVISKRLTIRGDNKITRGGIAMGTAFNVANSSDILALMMVQSNIRIPDSLNSESAAAALDFYTNFTKVGKVWDATMPYSTIAFATGRVGMIFARSTEIKKVLNLNPTLEFGIMDVPQLPVLEGGLTNNNWASFWVESVSADSTSQEQAEAWKFLKWMAQSEQQIDLNRELSKYSKVTEVSGNKTLAGIFSDDKYLSVIAKGAPTSFTNLVSDNTGNDKYAKILKDAIENRSKSQKSAFDLLTVAKTRYKTLINNRFKGYGTNK